MQTKQMFSVVALAATMGGVGVLQTQNPQYTKPEVSNVTMKQVAFSRSVEITYTLSEAAAIITLAIETNGVAIPDSRVTRLSGDVCKEVVPGANKKITWSAGADWPENITDEAVARVTAWSLDAPPDVMVVDLSKGRVAGAANQYPVYYYPSTEALPGGVLAMIYKHLYLVMQKIPSGIFVMGEGTTNAVPVNLT